VAEAVAVGAEAGARQQPEAPRQHAGLVRQDVAEQVLRDDDVERRRPPHEVHRHRVHEHVLERDVRELLARAPG